ncbi:MAG: hypothetical protein GC180_07545 [Bacteroidetes bacterium]|nr:hypothetical protein [Bacteroidota bacterium]
MKKIVLSLAASALLMGGFAYAHSTSSHKKECAKSEDCASCPVTPDCQPGDAWCVCLEECEK